LRRVKIGRERLRVPKFMKNRMDKFLEFIPYDLFLDLKRENSARSLLSHLKSEMIWVTKKETVKNSIE
jgi:hypothetical protein